MKAEEPNKLLCADCGGQVGQDRGPPDGWQLEDGRTVCHECCLIDFDKLVELAKKLSDETLGRPIVIH